MGSPLTIFIASLCTASLLASGINNNGQELFIEAPPYEGLSEDPKEMLTVEPPSRSECRRSLYTKRIVQLDATGRRCSDLVSSWSCHGNCVSQQVAIWNFPYRHAYHPVCVHAGRVRSVVYLRDCDDGVAPETRRHEYVEAVDCKCQACLSINTRCVAPHGGPDDTNVMNMFSLFGSSMLETDDN